MVSDLQTPVPCFHIKKTDPESGWVPLLMAALMLRSEIMLRMPEDLGVRRRKGSRCHTGLAGCEAPSCHP